MALNQHTLRHNAPLHIIKPRMIRRHSLSILLGAVAGKASSGRKLDRFFDSGGGNALLLDVATRRVIAATSAINRVAPPGSTLKPFVLAGLLKLGRLRGSDAFVCPGRLRIGGRTLDCSHPAIDIPMQIDTALAYSCNCFVAHAAERFAPGELAAVLMQAGFSGARNRGKLDGQQLQALGEDGALITVEELAHSYRNLALSAPDPI